MWMRYIIFNESIKFILYIYKNYLFIYIIIMMKIINFIHIPKNGGTLIKQICNSNNLNSIKLNYNGHSIDVNNKKIINHLVVIRNPIDRFISSVNYALQYFAHEPDIKYLIKKNINTPEKWVNIWSNPNHPEHNKLMLEMFNKNHKIGNKIFRYKWTYLPQNLWINNPKFVLIMDNFDQELNLFLKKYNIHKPINLFKNNTKKIANTLSAESINFLHNFYKEDFILYEKYKNINIEQRI